MRGFLLPLFAGVLAAVPVVEALAQSGVVGRIELISVWGYGKPPETNDWRDAHVRDPSTSTRVSERPKTARCIPVFRTTRSCVSARMPR